MSGYIGTQPVPQATQTRDSFTATSGQTSFATGGYTPNFLDVYLNGVKLASADYTATNGSDVVLATGAATGDILEVVAFTAFDTANVTGATNFTVTGAFTSQGIDDNGNATALTIDGNENVLIGRTTLSGTDNTQGAYIFNEGAFVAQRSSNPSLYLNRYGTDGDIALFRKSGTSVGSIGAESGTHLVISTPQNAGNLVFKGNDTGGTETRLAIVNITGSEAVRPYNSYSDNKYDLGSSSRRFKDAYLSGGVYLGGTGAANKLDDYEEGTFTPSVISGWTAVTYNNQSGTYTKVGRLVHFQITLTAAAGNRTANGSRFDIGGLPFVKTGEGAGVSVWSDLWSMGGSNNTANGLIGAQTIQFYQSNYASGGESPLTGTEMNSGSGNELYISGTYEAT